MCPELWVRKLVTSPVTHTCPISFSMSRRTFAVNSETVSTRRTVACGGKSSPKSHWLCALLPIVHERFGNALNAARFACAFVDVNDRALQIDAVLRDCEPLWHVGDETLDDGFDVAPKNALMRAGESRVTKKRGTAGKDLFVGRLHMGVSTDDRADLAVEHARESNLLRSSFGVQIEQNDFGLLAEPLHLWSDDCKWVVEIGHENTPLKIRYGNRATTRNLKHAGAAP